jgi:16S rRNA processing protein RimM
MHAKENLFELGKVIRIKGIKGEIELFLDSDNPGHYHKMESILVELNHDLVPFFIEQIKINGKIATVKLEGTNTLEDALQLVDAPVFLPLEQLPPITGNRYYFHDIKGCGVIDKSLGYIGEIMAIYDLPKQPLAEVMFNGKEILFPLLDHFIEKLDKPSKTLYVDLPEGLVDIYIT